MSNMSKKCKDKLRSFGDHQKFLSRISKTLYYTTKLPKTDRLSLPVSELASELFSEAKVANASIERLHCNDAADISRKACISPCSLVLALLYLDRLKTCNPEYLQCAVPSELFLVSLLVSSKFLYDDGEEDEVCLQNWATSGNLSKEELMQMEREFLNAIQWKIFVSEAAFFDKLYSMEETIANKEGMKRGWFTYTELEKLMSIIDAHYLISTLSGVFTVLMTAYVAGILTMVGSMVALKHIPGNCLQNYTQSVSTAPNNTYYINQDALPYEELPIRITLPSEIVNNNLCFNNFESNENSEMITWDWWKSVSLVWLAKISRSVENTIVNTTEKSSFTLDKTIEKCLANSKKVDLEDHIKKQTKTRLQDQLENNWHKEWTDTIKSAFYSYALMYT